MHILVTGGAGYIGSHTVRRLERAGHSVWVYDNLEIGHREAVREDRLIEGDIRDQAKLTAVLREKEIDAVVHFAAYAIVPESMADPAMYYDNNVIGSLRLLEAMRAAGVKRIVFSSTTATYGIPPTLPITEDDPQQPINPYGFSKLATERALADYAAAYGFAYAALRYFNAAGASIDEEIGEDHFPETHLIPLVLQVALGQRPHITVYGEDYPTPDGTCVRDYIHVDDLAAAHLLALERLQPGVGLKLNLGAGRGYSVREIISMCRYITDCDIVAVSGPQRAGDPPALVADPSLAMSVLNWQPRHSDLESIVATAWNWHRTHPYGYEDRDPKTYTRLGGNEGSREKQVVVR